MSGVSRMTISRIENGMFMPDLITLVCIARALDVELADLLDGIKWWLYKRASILEVLLN